MNDQEQIRSEILIVDDSPTVLATATKMLQDKYTVNTASNGKEAWEVLQQNLSIAMIFSDMQMPEMNGLELLIKLRESKDMHLSNIPVIMITGASDTPAGKQAVFDIGATDFIGKPFNALDLLTRTRAHIDSKGINKKRRASDMEQEGASDILASPSSFHSVGCQSLDYVIENNTEFTVVYIELTNFDEIHKKVGENNSKAIILSVAKRINETIRDEDVATRIGQNKFAVLYNSTSTTAQLAVERLCEYMGTLVFEFNDEKLKTEMMYGVSTADYAKKDSTFTEICLEADAALQSSITGQYVEPIVSYKQTKSKPGKQSLRGKINLWFSLKKVLDGDYKSISISHQNKLVKCMNKYLEYAGLKSSR